MTQEYSSTDPVQSTAKPKWKHGEVRPLTTDERTSFVILSLYLMAFCLCTFIYWNSLPLRILGLTAGSGGLFLFVAAFFNTEAPEKSHSIHPVRSYAFSLITILLLLLVIRIVGGFMGSFALSAVVIYSGLLVALVVFRKALVQVVTTLLLVVFVFVTVANREDILEGRMDLKDSLRQCGTICFQLGPVQDVVNLVLSGNYMGYLSRVDYRDRQINILAIRTVADTNDDDIQKTRAILDYVSNQIHYVSDPDDGMEFVKDPLTTLEAGGGDCEDQTLLLCSMLESVGVKTYIAFTDDHVFALARFHKKNRGLDAKPFLFIDGFPCYALDAADPGADIGRCAAIPLEVKRVFDVRRKAPVRFSLGKNG